jgi:hypothetical protein
MHVFICWSGRRSRRIAEAFSSQWLPAVLGDTVTSFVSFADIEKGEGWFDRLLTELSKADAALLCLTPENIASPWMHFESGMVARMGRGTVFTYFLGTDAGKIQDPLKQIQVTVSTEIDTNRLALKLAAVAKAPENDVRARLLNAWDGLAKAIQEVATPKMDDIFPGLAQLFERKTFDERLEDCADQLWLKRYQAAGDTSHALIDRRDAVRTAAEPWQVWLYEKLVHQVDAYVDEIKQYLLLERPFEVGDDGRIDFGSPRAMTPAPAPRSLSTVCERRCAEIRHIIFCLSSPDGAPVLPECLAFAKLRKSQFDDKKRMIHAKGLRVDRASLGLASPADLERCARSVWDYDRIMYFKACESDPIPVGTMLALVGQELEKMQAEDEASKMALHYSIKTLVSTMRKSPNDTFDARDAARLVDDLQKFLDGSGPENNDPKIRRNVAEVGHFIEDRDRAVH